MIVEIDIEKLMDYGVNFHEFMFLQFIYQQQQATFDTYISIFDKFFDKDSLDNLVELGYLQFKNATLGYRFNNLKVSEKFIDHFIEKPFISKIAKEKVEDWIDEWYELWPKGVKSGGYLVRSDKNGCINKMKKFMKLYDYDKDVIIRATKDYINHLRMSNFAYIQCAHYFIFKNDSSNLASSCEDIKERLESKEIENLEVDYSVDRFTRTLNDGD